jgi:hypothetical protein
MLLVGLGREWAIRRVLKQLARQRVGLVLQPGNVWIVENAVPDDDHTDAALKTCYMRGWVEPLANSIPKGHLLPDGSLPTAQSFQTSGPVWKLTDSGWAAINRAHEWTLIGILIAAVSVIIALVT